MYQGKRILATLLLVLVVLAGCTHSAPGPAPQNSEVVTLRLGVLGSDPVLDALISAFEAKHADIRIEKVTIYNATLLEYLGLIREKKVDVMAGFAAGMLAPSQVQALDPYLQKDKFDLAPLGRMEDLQIKGYLYDLPLTLSPFVLTYNQDLFSQAGVTLPAGTITWDEFRDLARKLSSGHGPDRIWGFHSEVVAYPLEIFVQEHSPKQDWWNDLKAVSEGYQFFSELIWQDGSCPPAPQLDQFGRPVTPPDEGFPAGKAAMTIGQITNFRGVTRSQMKLVAGPLPVASGSQPLGLVVPLSLSIAATTDYTDAAWQFVRFAVGPDGAPIIAKAGAMPAYRTPETMQLWADSLPAQLQALKPLATMPLKLARDDGSNPEYEKVRVAAWDALSGKKTWQQALESYKSANKNAH